MIEYRSFHNTDPPRLVKLWHSCSLGRGAAEGFGSDALETVNFSQPYFDPAGLIIASSENGIVGFVHAGFCVNDQQTHLNKERGVICAIMVHPDYRRQGIGRELIARAEQYLAEQGATSQLAGASVWCDPFYVGIYGGTRPAGFLESDPSLHHFFQALGYHQFSSQHIYQRDLGNQKEPIDFKLVAVRRKMQLAISQQPEKPSWWWVTRFGRLDTIRFLLVPKKGGPPVAGLTVSGLDFYLNKWNERAIGLTELFVAENERRKRYGQMLVSEVCRKMKDELVTRAEIHIAEENEAALGLIGKCGFEKVDTGFVYQK